ncbi:uncharacterized protein LOC128324839 [Hemicordylus capensis]|uniref:uncharacterized protein LOC128324839 n=1 Tax=Hemicordylus capensis TaxID=884348 RepID=UPI002303645D|nr:uncharacterized protein LOC128324839 [Hemicordylus capensis]
MGNYYLLGMEVFAGSTQPGREGNPREGSPVATAAAALWGARDLRERKVRERKVPHPYRLFQGMRKRDLVGVSGNARPIGAKRGAKLLTLQERSNRTRLSLSRRSKRLQEPLDEELATAAAAPSELSSEAEPVDAAALCRKGRARANPASGFFLELGRKNLQAMLGFRKAVRFLNAGMRNPMVPRANIVGNPAKHPLSVAEQAIGLVVMFATFLVPSGYILANLEHYKQRSD